MFAKKGCGPATPLSKTQQTYLENLTKIFYFISYSMQKELRKISTFKQLFKQL